MRGKIFAILLTAFIMFSCSSTTQIQKMDTIHSDYIKTQPIGPKKRIIISEFENQSGYEGQRLGKGISDILLTELAKTNNFILLEREKLNTVMKEQSLGQSGFIDEKTAPKLGKLLGANAIITGSITQFGVRTETHDIVLTSGKKQVADCAVDLRIIDANTGEVTWAGSGKGEAIRKYTNILGSGKAGSYDETLEGEAFRAAIVKVMENLMAALNKIPWTCTIAQVSDQNIYVNAGEKSNLKINTNLIIYKTGKPIIDPTTGRTIGREETKIGTASVISHFGNDGSILKLLSGSKPNIGDICRLKQQ